MATAVGIDGLVRTVRTTPISGVVCKETVTPDMARDRSCGHLLFTCLECGTERVYGFAVPCQPTPTDNPAPYLACHACKKNTAHSFTRVAS